jgi:hypothetical protein
MFRILVLCIFVHVSLVSSAQHVNLHWYVLKSVAPLDVVEGKMALVRIQQITNDSLSTFIDRDDYFSVATHTPIDWPTFEASMSSSGFAIADITHPDIHHGHYVKMGLSYQTANYLLGHPEELQQANTQKPVLLNQAEVNALATDKQNLIDLFPQFFIREP